MTDQKYKDLMNGGWSYPKKESTDPEEVKKVVDKYLTDNKIDSETIDKKITDGVSKIVADAPEDFDTLKEMSDWISQHSDSAAAMNSDILDNKSSIESLQKDKANATDVETLSGEVETLKTEVNNNTNDISEINDNLSTEDVDVFSGWTIQDSNRIVCDISVNGNDVLYWYLNFSWSNTINGGVIAYYDNSGTKISEDSIYYPATNKMKGNYTVPNNAVKARFILYFENGVTSTKYPTNVYLNKKPTIRGLGNAISNVNSDLDNLSYGETAGGKNLFKIDTTNWTLTDNGIKNNAKNDGYLLGKTKLFAGKTYKISFLLKSKPTVDSSFTAYIDGSVYSACTFAHFNSYALDVKVEKDYTATSDCELLYKLWGNSNSDIFEFQLQVEEGTVATDYKPYIPSVKMLADDVEVINDSLSVLGKCKNLLKPTLGSGTGNGITYVNNGDGSFTLSGTCTNTFELHFNSTLKLPYGKYKLLGTSAFQKDNNGAWKATLASGDVFEVSESKPVLDVIAYITSGSVVDKTFKPMVTANLNATADDFVPYTGDGDTLTEDVAKINNWIDGLITTKTFIKSIGTSSSPAVSGQDYDISTSVYIDGYNAIGIINARIMNNYCSKFHIYGFNVDNSSTAIIRTRCDVSGVSSEDLATEFTVLYVKQ